MQSLEIKTKMKRNCNHCGREYEADMRNVKRGWGLCCSKSCAAYNREKLKTEKNMEQNNIPARVQAIIIDKLAVDPEEVNLESKIKEDLGADSLDLIEVIMCFEDEFSITIPDELLEQDMTVQQAITLVEERCSGKK